ncbi:MAG: tetratricopeptide repeat protein [Thermoanaerobaculia bacterium]
MALNRQKVIRAAEKLVHRGRIEAAIDEFRKVLVKYPNDTSTLNRVGDLYARLNRLDEATDLFKQTAEHFGREGFYVKAIAIYKKIIRLDPTQIEVYEQLADLYHRQGLVTEARAQYEVVADYYEKQRDLPATTTIHQKIVELEPENPSHRLRLAELYQQQEQLNEAMAQYRAIASLMLAHGRVEEATQVCLKALEIDASDLSFIAGAVQEIRESGHAQEADRLLQAAIEINPEAADIAETAEPLLPAAAETEGAEPAEPTPEEAVEEPPTGATPEEEGVTVVDLDEVAQMDAAEEAVEAEPAATEVDEVEFEFDLEELAEEAEAAAGSAGAEVAEVAEVDERLAELLSEAEVLAKYGLEDKAAERLEEALQCEPQHLETHSRLITLYLRSGHRTRVAELANRLAEISPDVEVSEAFDRVREQLLGEGFVLEDDRFSAPPEEAAAEQPSVEPKEEEAPTTPSIDVSWLEEPGPETAEAEQTAEALFSEEEEFFDLASELEEELLKDGTLQEEELVAQQTEQTLEDIVEGFKKGMAETLSTEDYDTHYNLGVAYREMGLLDEAIGEFQLAAKDPRYLIDCCSLLAACFAEKGFPELAIKWYKRALDSPTITEDETLGLVYELADLYLSIGDNEAARERFVEIYGINSNYRDVVAKLEELGHS